VLCWCQWYEIKKSTHILYFYKITYFILALLCVREQSNWHVEGWTIACNPRPKIFAHQSAGNTANKTNTFGPIVIFYWPADWVLKLMECCRAIYNTFCSKIFIWSYSFSTVNPCIETGLGPLYMKNIRIIRSKDIWLTLLNNELCLYNICIWNTHKNGYCVLSKLRKCWSVKVKLIV